MAHTNAAPKYTKILNFLRYLERIFESDSISLGKGLELLN